MNVFRTAVAAAALTLAACQASETNTASPSGEERPTTQIAPILTTPDAKDDASYARPLEARVHHVALDLTVDFDAKRIGGTATLDIDRKPEAKEIVLDDKGLEIASITDGEGQPLQYKVGAADPKLGAPLAVTLGPDTKRLIIKYKSAPDAGALQWLTPEQTAGKKKPYLFSQGQAIENRSWIPTQDSSGHPPDVGGGDPRSRRPDCGHERPESRRAHDPGRRERLQLQDAAQRRALHDRDRRRRPRVPRTRSPHRRLDRTGHARPRRRRARRHRENGRGGREALRPVSLGSLRPARPPARLPLRRNGKSHPHLPHADLHRRRQEPRRPRRARAGAQLVGQSGHQRDLGRQLAQRGFHLLFRKPDHGGDLRSQARGAGGRSQLR